MRSPYQLRNPWGDWPQAASTSRLVAGTVDWSSAGSSRIPRRARGGGPRPSVRLFNLAVSRLTVRGRRPPRRPAQPRRGCLSLKGRFPRRHLPGQGLHAVSTGRFPYFPRHLAVPGDGPRVSWLRFSAWLTLGAGDFQTVPPRFRAWLRLGFSSVVVDLGFGFDLSAAALSLRKAARVWLACLRPAPVSPWARAVLWLSCQ